MALFSRVGLFFKRHLCIYCIFSSEFMTARCFVFLFLITFIGTIGVVLVILLVNIVVLSQRCDLYLIFFSGKTS